MSEKMVFILRELKTNFKICETSKRNKKCFNFAFFCYSALFFFSCAKLDRRENSISLIIPSGI